MTYHLFKPTYHEIILFVFLLISVSLLTAQPIERIEYFIDTDPGFGNATAVSFTQDSVVSLNFNASLAGLPAGFHMLYIRAKDTTGHWGITNYRPFYLDNISQQLPTPTITAMEYFIDTDPGFGNATPISFSGDSLVDNSFVADLSGLSVGFHILYVRAKNSAGDWSLTHYRPFYLDKVNPQAPRPLITAMEYFVDTDPGFGNGTPIAISPDSLVEGGFTVCAMDIDTGGHQFYIRAQDENGNWSLTNYAPLDMPQVTALPLTAALGTDYDICEGETVQVGGVQAYNGSPPYTYSWSPATGLSNPDIGNPLIMVDTTTTYTLTITDANNCSASRNVTVTVLPLPVVEAGNDTSICFGETAQLSATGSGFFDWTPSGSLSNANVASPVASPTVSTSYVVTLTGTNSCTNVDTVNVAVTPEILISSMVTNVSSAGANDGSVDVLVSGGVAPYQVAWSTGATTFTIDNLAAGSYVAAVTDGNGCVVMDTTVVEEPPPPPCERPLNLPNSAVGNTITLSWPSNPDAVRSQIQYRVKPGQAGAVPNSGTLLNSGGVFTRTFTINVANCGFIYQARVRYICAADNSILSPWKFATNIQTPAGCARQQTKDLAIELYPNPTSGLVSLVYPAGRATDLNVRIFDILGKEVIQQDMRLPEGIHTLTFDVQTFEPGMYFMEIDDGGRKVIEKFVKQ